YMELLYKKIAPKKVDELLIRPEEKQKLVAWLSKALYGKAKPLLIYGKPGTGKTATAYAIANEFSLELIEMNASQERTKEQISKILIAASLTSSLFKKKKLILIDEVDEIFRADTGAEKAILTLIQNSNHPIILTANDIWDEKLRFLRNQDLERIEYKGVSPFVMKEFLMNVAKKEKIEINKINLEYIANSAKGDIRGALNDLEALKEGSIEILGEREKERKIFEVLDAIFFGENALEVIKLADVDLEMILNWVEENIINVTNKKERIAEALSVLSKIDIYQRRIIKRNYYGYQRYISAFLAYSLKIGEFRKLYSFPGIIKKLNFTKERRNKEKDILKKIGIMCHTNEREARSYIQLLKKIFEKENVEEIAGIKKEEIEELFI
ncbi:MAG: replication factor C large subunit, partial [Candidatus Micrarchaeales archaeon]